MQQVPVMQGTEARAGRAPRLLDQVHEAIRRLHYSRRTEEAYAYWIKFFILWSGKRHPAKMGEAEVTAFLNHLATERNVAAATQNQALAALLFLYKQVLGMDLAWLDGVVRAKRPVRLPERQPAAAGAQAKLAVAGHDGQRRVVRLNDPSTTLGRAGSGSLFGLSGASWDPSPNSRVRASL